MRRSELRSEDPHDFDKAMNEGLVGSLGLLGRDGYPLIIPVNFCVKKGKIYFHGASEGEKHDLVMKQPDMKASFSVFIPYSFIPSNWLSKKQACMATQFFKSVFVRGQVHLVSDDREKQEALQCLMVKYQDEMSFERIENTNPLYHVMLKKTSVYCFMIESMTMKIKFGQNEPEHVRQRIKQHLEQRGTALDKKTLHEIQELEARGIASTK